MKPLLLARQLSYGVASRPRLSNFDLQLQRGDRLGLLGVNGAGKSTLMQVLAGILAPSDGEVRILGQRLDQAGPTLRRHIGYLPQRVPIYPELTVRENMDWAGRLRGLKGQPLRTAAEGALQQVELGAFSRRLAGRLSAGMEQRLGLAQAIMHQPDILILDEPTAGLDPLQTEQVRDLLRNLSADTSVILATHLLDDVQQLCNRVILLDEGRKTAEHEVTPDIDLLQYFRQQAHSQAVGTTA